LQEARNLLGAENERKLVRLLAPNNTFECLHLTQGDPIEKPQCTSYLIDVRSRSLLLDQL
jgi:hypothetical protein